MSPLRSVDKAFVDCKFMLLDTRDIPSSLFHHFLTLHKTESSTSTKRLFSLYFKPENGAFLVAFLMFVTIHSFNEYWIGLMRCSLKFINSTQLGFFVSQEITIGICLPISQFDSNACEWHRRTLKHLGCDCLKKMPSKSHSVMVCI